MKVFTLIFITIVSMIISSCKNENNNDFSFSKTYWECPKEGGKEIFTSNKEEWKIDQLILDGIIIKEYSPEYIDKNQSFPPDKFEFDFFSFKIEGKKVTICILENTTRKSRSIKFICRHVNTYHTITVVQLPDINIIEHSGN